MSSNGVYGTRIASNITSDDVEIFYAFSPTRNSDDVNEQKFTQMESTFLTDAITTDGNPLEGMKNLKLPLSIFNRKGFYQVLIRPKEVHAVISNVSTLVAYPEVRGIILDITKNSALGSAIQVNNGLVGYRIVYLDDKGDRENYHRVITSNNSCEPVQQAIANANQNGTRYRFSESATLSFITVTPSVAPSFKSNATPYIGRVGQEIIIINTKFEPILLDIEMVENDIDTLTALVNGSQLRDLDNGLVTTFNNNNEIISQAEHYTLKDNYTSKPVYEVRKLKNDNIDFTQTLNDK